MADSFIQVATDGSGKKLDTRTEGTNTEHRQVVVIGDPATNASVAPVDATNGLSVSITNASLTVAAHALTAGTAYIGSVGGTTVVKTLAMTTDTNVYASGDLIADTQQLDAAFRLSNGTGVLNSITIIDQDAQGVALYIMLHNTTTSMGTENSAPNISDANLAAGLQGVITVATTDYVTVSGAKVACLKNLGIPIKAVSGTDDLYVSVLNSTGTPTFTATGLNLALGILQD